VEANLDRRGGACIRQFMGQKSWRPIAQTVHPIVPATKPRIHRDTGSFLSGSGTVAASAVVFRGLCSGPGTLMRYKRI
jgi:hypothetical protein